jgi:hypothetical protein
MQTLDVLVPRKRAVGSCEQVLIYRLYEFGVVNVPRVSAAMRIPSLNLIARTLEPVTIGCLIDASSELYPFTKIQTAY